MNNVIKFPAMESNIRVLPKSYPSTIGINCHDGIKVIKVDSILYCESSSNYTIIHFNDGRQLVASKTLKHVQHFLSPSKYIRIHQSYLVAIDRITQVGSSLELSNQIKLPISTKKRKDLLETLKSKITIL